MGGVQWRIFSANPRETTMAEILKVTPGPVQIDASGAGAFAAQGITEMLDVIGFDDFQFFVRLYEFTGASFKVYLYTSMQNSVDDLILPSTNDDSITRSFVNVQSDGTTDNPLVTLTAAGRKVVRVSGLGGGGSPQTTFRYLRWAAVGTGTFSIEAVARSLLR